MTTKKKQAHIDVEQMVIDRLHAIAGELKPGDEAYLPPLFGFEINGKPTECPISWATAGAGLEPVPGKLNFWRLAQP